MKRPLLMQVAPPSIRAKIYYHLYRSRKEKWPQLYHDAYLHFAPNVRMDLCLSDSGHSQIAFTGFYELDLSARIQKHSQQGGLMLDVGANYGYFSLLWAAVSSRNRVISLEASPRNQAALQRNVTLNGFANQIQIIDMAAGRENGQLSFSIGPEHQTGWGGFSNGDDNMSIQVAVVTLDSLVPSTQQVEVLKIDVEGADTWVLYGAEKLLKAKRIKHIYFEQNKNRMRSLGIFASEASDYLKKIGYRVSALNNADSELVEYYASPAA